jgi:hypothetical protein
LDICNIFSSISQRYRVIRMRRSFDHEGLEAYQAAKATASSWDPIGAAFSISPGTRLWKGAKGGWLHTRNASGIAWICISQDVWCFRYCQEVQHPSERIGACTPDGIPYLRPEIALLYKAARMRQVDDEDFRRVLPCLAGGQRAQLTQDIRRFSPEHPWLALLR